MLKSPKLDKQLTYSSF